MADKERKGSGHESAIAVENFLCNIGSGKWYWDSQLAREVFEDRVSNFEVTDPAEARYLGDLADIFANHAELQEHSSDMKYFQDSAASLRQVQKLLEIESRSSG